MKKCISLFFTLLCCLALRAQMPVGTDTLYGNEWIDHSKPYFALKITSDGLYRIPQQTLAAAGLPLGSVTGGQWRLYRNGAQVPMFSSTEGLFGTQDYLEFYGQANRGEVDAHLFDNVEGQQVNPLHSMFSDSSTYYLSWSDTGPALRYAALPNTLDNLPPKTEYCWFTSRLVYGDYHFKRSISDEISYSWFDGNGFTGPFWTTSNTYPIAAPQIYAAGPPATATVRYACGLGQHRQRIFWNDSLQAEDQFSQFKIVQRSFPLSQNLLAASNTLRLSSTLDGNDRHALAYATLRYPRVFHFQGTNQAAFELDAAAAAQYLEIEAFNAENSNPVLYDLDNLTRQEAGVEAGLLKLKVPGRAATARFFLTSQAAIRSVAQLQPLNFRNYAAEPAADYIILSNPALQDDGAGGNPVAEYADYRRSAAGGSHAVLVVDVHDLYQQFAYGVRYHPLGIRNFLHWAKKQWPGLKHTFIIGKALDYNNFRSPGTQNALADSLFFVPTFSTPGADLSFTMARNRLSTPVTSIGRLAAVRPQQIRDYLEKVREQEQQNALAGQSIADKAWMKRVIHNSGGGSGESAIIRSYTSDMANALGSSRFGADVRTFYKTSNDPIQLSSYEQMLGLINEGVSVWTIFGHSSPFAVDFDIGTPDVYSNKGRYPLMLIMGCFSGICSSPQAGIGEQFVLAPDRGAIAYVATANYGFIDALHTYARRYYDHLGNDHYGRSIGEAMSATIGDLQSSTYPSLMAILHQNVLQGDPAIRLYHQPGPDYVIDNQSVVFNPNPVGLEQSNVQLRFEVANIGENKPGLLPIKVEQRLPDGTLLSRKLDTIAAPAFRSKLQYSLPTTGSRIGFNRFFVSLDADNGLEEKPAAAELNNELADASGQRGMDVYFYSDDITPVYPQDFAVVGNATPRLLASTLNTNAAPNRYLFEIDTLETFSSPLKRGGAVLQRGGLVAWQPPISLRDSTVYYWRVARDSLVDGQILWRERSFLHLHNSPGGWNQSHYGQYLRNNLSNVQGDAAQRSLEFADNAVDMTISVAYRHTPNTSAGFQNSFYEGFYGNFGWNVEGVGIGTIVTLADPVTGRFVKNPAGGPYNYSPAKDRLFFWFRTQDSLERVRLMQFLENGIPDGHYVGLLAFNAVNDPIGYAPQFWANDSVSYGKNLFQILEQQGAKEVRQLANVLNAPHPYGLFYRKNDPDFPAVDTTVTDVNQELIVRGSFLSKWATGQVETPPIGPAKAWKSVHWRRDAFDDGSDEGLLSVLGVREGSTDTLLLRFPVGTDTTLEFIPAGQFPLLRLRYGLRDTLSGTATQLRMARLLFEAVPEGALHPVARFDFQRDTLQQGEPMRASVAFANVSDSAMDSLLVQFTVEGQSGGGSTALRRLRALPAGDTLHAEYQSNTLNFNGLQRLIVEVNPDEDQPERYHFNNVLVQEFFVSRDRRNPLLDVTFDGQHILDGDLVSPQPQIVLTLKDDNRFLAISDSSTFSLTLVRPDGSIQNIPYDDPTLLFLPADPARLPEKNLARMEWRPAFEQDGEYRLLVNGKDASGNESAALDWSVTFRVITKSSISNVLNYPNPFSTNTCFVYTMTGAETPLHFRLQIMTVSGKVVREVTEQEFGPLRAGTHQSDFCWDGKDQFGDQLANGVYLYRVLAKKADGSDFEFFENQAIDGYFKKGFGKMVLMR